MVQDLFFNYIIEDAFSEKGVMSKRIMPMDYCAGRSGVDHFPGRRFFGNWRCTGIGWKQLTRVVVGLIVRICGNPGLALCKAKSWLFSTYFEGNWLALPVKGQ